MSFSSVAPGPRGVGHGEVVRVVGSVGHQAVQLRHCHDAGSRVLRGRELRGGPAGEQQTPLLGGEGPALGQQIDERPRHVGWVSG
jgi:hypothetical protein